MINATMELISLVSSNTLLVFCFFNLIIVILLVSTLTSNSATSHNETSDSVIIMPMNTKGSEEHVMKDGDSFSIRIEASLDIVEEVSSVKEVLVNDNEYDGKYDEEDEDELRKRFEEFIEKTNRGWKAENLGNSGYVYSLERNLGGTLVT